MSKLTHFNAAGEAEMVDVGAKPETHRSALAEGWIRMQPRTLSLIQDRIGSIHQRLLASSGFFDSASASRISSNSFIC